MKELTLAKILVVDGDQHLDKKFKKYYYSEVNLYVFSSVILYYPEIPEIKGRMKLHDRIIADLNIPEVPDDKLNYLSVDIEAGNRTQLYVNSRHLQLDDNQIQFLMKMFNVDHCSRKVLEVS